MRSEGRRADREAGEALIPEAIWATAEVRTSHAAEDAVSLARQLQVHSRNHRGKSPERHRKLAFAVEHD